MKYLMALFLSGLLLPVSAQSPPLINYQGMARDVAGAPLINRQISLRFEIRQGSPTGAVIFTENQDAGVNTGPLGIFSTQIGKNSQLNSVNWQNGPYFLEVSIDENGGQNYIALGTQQLASVPFALATPPPVLSYSSEVLAVNGSTIQIAQPVNQTFYPGTNVTISGGPSYTVASTPSLSVNGASIGISGGNFVEVPTATVTATGMAAVTPSTGGSYVVDVPTPTYVATTGVLAFGTNTVNITPQLSLNNGSLTAGPAGNSVPFPVPVTVSGSGMANVSGAPDYTVTVTPPTLTYNQSSGNLSISGGNTVTLPPAFPQGTLTPGGIVNVNSLGTNSFNVTAPLPTYDPVTGALAFGSQVTTVTPTLQISGSTISSGPASNSVSIAGAFPWTKSASNVTLATGADRVGIGANASSPTAKLDVQGENTLTVPVVKVNHTNATSSAAALDVTSAGSLGMQVTNNSPSGVGGSFTSSLGVALTANNNSSFYTFQATNVNTLATSYAGYFDGGFVAKGKGATTNMILSARNSTADVFIVRNDGRVGVGTNTPSQTLDVAGTVKIADGTEGAGKVLTSDALGNASWEMSSVITTTSFGVRHIASLGSSPVTFSTPIASFTKANTNTRVQVIVQTQVLVQDLIGTFSVLFEVKIGNNTPVSNTGRVNYFRDNGGALNVGDYMPVTIIAEFAPGISGGTTYNVNIQASATGAGSATDIFLDPGTFGASSVIIKEYR